MIVGMRVIFQANLFSFTSLSTEGPLMSFSRVDTSAG